MLHRQKCLRLGNRSRSEAEALVEMCRRDILFWLNTFVWMYDPRAKGYKRIPWITWPAQDHFIDGMFRAVKTGEDFLLCKCRAIGGSYSALAVFDHFCTFGNMEKFLLVSQKESLVDEKENPDSLMVKIDWIHKLLPWWLDPEADHTHLCLIVYPKTDARITGCSNTQNAGISTRCTAAMIDEAAHLADDEPGKDYAMMRALLRVTDCRIEVSSPYGSGVFYDDYHNSDMEKVHVTWWDVPPWREGITQGKDGKPTSPWLERWRKKCKTIQEFNSEILGIFEGSTAQYFDPDTIAKRIAEDAKPPLHVGHLDVDEDTAEVIGFREDEDGPLKLWVDLVDGKPPYGWYVSASDPSAGTPDATGRGYSNSVNVIYDRHTKTKVAEYALSTRLPHEFTADVVALAKWFRMPDSTAYVIWERNGGPGATMTRFLERYGCDNMWYGRDEERTDRQISQKPGWWSGTSTRKMAFGLYNAALEQAAIHNSSKIALQECLEYENAGGDVVHRGARASKSPLEGRDLHGDRVIADMLANIVMSEDPEIVEDKPEYIPDNCPMARRMAHEKAMLDKMANKWSAGRQKTVNYQII